MASPPAGLHPLPRPDPIPNHLSVLTAHLLCVGLVFTDLIARAFRIQFFLRGLGHRITFGEAFTLNAFGDAACALTPLRIGGEPARLGGMLRARVPATAAFVAISIEILAAWPVVIISAALLAWAYAPQWWAAVGPHLERFAHHAWPWLVVVTLLSVLAWLAARRRAKSAVRNFRRPIRRVMVYWRRMPRWPVLASLPLTFINVVARTALLPVLALTVSDPPAIGPTAVGSFALLYSQLILPTPSGAGAVDLGFMAGAAGDLGDGSGLLLLAWRFYSVGAGALLGFWLAGRIYGWKALKNRMSRRTSEPTAGTGLR
ncbi:MAG: lysylphosphatidylglycerol synthase domain-containing protein [Gemmatimonadota bacterium]